MRKNYSPYDVPKYNWGRWEDNYPRANAREWAIKDQEASWEEAKALEICTRCKGLSHGPGPCSESFKPYFTRPKLPSPEEPDHANPREKYSNKPCDHEWIEIKDYRKDHTASV